MDKHTTLVILTIVSQMPQITLFFLKKKKEKKEMQKVEWEG